jgi:hypothetical protein
MKEQKSRQLAITKEESDARRGPNSDNYLTPVMTKSLHERRMATKEVFDQSRDRNEPHLMQLPQNGPSHDEDPNLKSLSLVADSKFIKLDPMKNSVMKLRPE